METSPPPDPLRPEATRSRIVAAAAALIAAGGADAATTRAVALAASVQAPTIYRLFGDKRGLLDAVAEQSLADYVATKARRDHDADPVGDLRDGWDAHIAFGLAHPALFALMANPSGATSPAAQAGLAVLRARVRRVARTGRLHVSEARAVDLIHATGTGVVLALLRKDPAERDGLADAAREIVFSAILDDPSPALAAGVSGLASALLADVEGLTMLTPGERHLLAELLHRVVASG